MRPGVRRWLIVAALFVVTYGLSTPLAAYGVFLPVLADAFRWSRGAIASALSLNLLLGGVAGLGIGALADRRGPRVLLLATLGLAGASFALVSRVQALWQLYLLVGVLGGIGMSSFYLLSAATVVRWFDDRRGVPLALVLVGFNLGYMSGGPAAAWLIARLGWRPAYAVLGGGCALVAALAALTVRLPRRGELPRSDSAMTAAPARLAAAPGATLGDALVDGRQWCLNGSWLMVGGISLMITVHVVPFARDRGLTLTSASLLLTAYGFGAVTGRIAAGAVSDRLGSATTIRLAYVLQVLALLTLVAASSRGVLLASLATFGIGFGAADTVFTKVIPDVFGFRALGAIMGVLALGWRFGAALGPALAGFLYDATGSYTAPFAAAPAVVLASWVLFTLGTRRTFGAV